MNQDVFIHRVALTMIDGIGDVLARQLISYCGSPEAVFREKKRILEKIPNIGPRLATAINSFRRFDRVEKEWEFVSKNRIRIFFYLDEDYPRRLKNCYDAPLILYYKGNADLNRSRMVAIVGTRNATPYGKQFTEELVMALLPMRATVVSGLAYGIDIAAHRASLHHGLDTLGVIAHGLDRIYPGAHAPVARKMTGQGGLVTEFMSGSDPDRENFPRRNRIIAGLCDAVVVVEAAGKGGALITADIANSYNRDVFALPGRVTDPQSQGCNNLIKQNRAALIQSAEDIRYLMGWDEEENKKKVIQKQMFVDLNEDEKQLFDFLTTNGSTPIDDIVYTVGWLQSRVASALLQLEFKGVIHALPGKRYEIV